MAISIKHSKVSTVPDSANSQIIQPSDWNSPLVSEINTGKLVGRTTAGSGPFEEISTGEGLTFANNEIKVNATIARTSDLTSAVNDLTGDIGDLASQTQTSLNLKLNASEYNASDILVKLRTVDGVGSGLDADYLAGQNANFYRNADNINAGTINNARLPARIGGSPWSNLIANWDWATTTGWYGGAQAENSPTEGYYVGLVESSTGVYLKQTLWEYAVMGSTDTKTWQRTGMWNVSQWEFGPWYRLRLSETEQQNLWDARYVQTTTLNTYGIDANSPFLADVNLAQLGTYSHFWGTNPESITANLPDTGTGSKWWNIHTYGSATRVTQTAIEIFGGLNKIFLRRKIDGVWYGWQQVWTSSTDGAGSSLDADLLDGQHGSYYQNAANINAGTIPDARLPSRLNQGQTVTDWDTAINPGFYTSDNTAMNAPVNGYLMGIVYNRAGGTHVIQDVTEISGDTPDTKTWRRNRENNVWRSWYRVRLSESEQQALWDARYVQTTTLNSYGVGASSITLTDANSAPIGTKRYFTGTNTQCVAANLPDLGGIGNKWWNIDTYGVTNRTTQVATEVFGTGDGIRNRTFVRVRHDATWYPWVQIWNSGSDGAGSGLDADLLDGQHGSYYQSRSNHTGTQSISTVDGLETALEESISMSTVMAIALG